MLSRLVGRAAVGAGQVRGLLRPPTNKPYKGVYRQDGEAVAEGELLVCQGKFNYVPGLNVYHVMDRGQNLLKAACDGTVCISTEWVERNNEDTFADKTMNAGLERRQKLTFNVIQPEPSNRFKLVTLI